MISLLDELDIERGTIILFTFDYGRLPSRGRKSNRALATSNEPLREGKGHVCEGGVRVPLIVSWPGRTSPGSVSEAITTNTDHFPTLLELLGLEALPDQHLDGVSITAAIFGQPIPRAGRSIGTPHAPGLTAPATATPAPSGRAPSSSSTGTPTTATSYSTSTTTHLKLPTLHRSIRRTPRACGSSSTPGLRRSIPYPLSAVNKAMLATTIITLQPFHARNHHVAPDSIPPVAACRHDPCVFRRVDASGLGGNRDCAERAQRALHRR